MTHWAPIYRITLRLRLRFRREQRRLRADCWIEFWIWEEEFQRFIPYRVLVIVIHREWVFFGTWVAEGAVEVVVGVGGGDGALDEVGGEVAVEVAVGEDEGGEGFGVPEVGGDEEEEFEGELAEEGADVGGLFTCHFGGIVMMGGGEG